MVFRSRNVEKIARNTSPRAFWVSGAAYLLRQVLRWLADIRGFSIPRKRTAAKLTTAVSGDVPGPFRDVKVDHKQGFQALRTAGQRAKYRCIAQSRQNFGPSSYI